MEFKRHEDLLVREETNKRNHLACGKFRNQYFLSKLRTGTYVLASDFMEVYGSKITATLLKAVMRQILK